MIDPSIRSLLEQYTRHNARGSLLAANQTMVAIVEALATLIDRPYQCACGKSVQPVVKPEPVKETLSLVICTNCGKPTDLCECAKTMPQAIKDELTIPPPPVKRGPGRPRKHPVS